eukprot:scaffold13039_cov72-Skeletonema_dohrnii-CCMP3373.AAC.1
MSSLKQRTNVAEERRGKQRRNESPTLTVGNIYVESILNPHVLTVSYFRKEQSTCILLKGAKKAKRKTSNLQRVRKCTHASLDENLDI